MNLTKSSSRWIRLDSLICLRCSSTTVLQACSIPKQLFLFCLNETLHLLLGCGLNSYQLKEISSQLSKLFPFRSFIQQYAHNQSGSSRHVLSILQDRSNYSTKSIILYSVVLTMKLNGYSFWNSLFINEIFRKMLIFFSMLDTFCELKFAGLWITEPEAPLTHRKVVFEAIWSQKLTSIN